MIIDTLISFPRTFARLKRIEYRNYILLFRDRIDCDRNSLEMDFDNPKIPRGPFENSEGHRGGTKDNNELSFRVPSIPNSPSAAITNSQPESMRQQRANEIHGSSSHGKNAFRRHKLFKDS